MFKFKTKILNFMKSKITIVAQITPPGIGAISVIRLSGDKSFDIIYQITNNKASLSHKKVIYTNIIDDGNIVDDVVITPYKAPNSYTGEDVIEISCHGNPIIVKTIIELCIKHGAVPANNGEFTERAFLNGKLNLLEAEAIADIINSSNDIALKWARKQKTNFYTEKINQLKESITNAISLVELELDFSEEDVEFIERGKLLELLQSIFDTISIYIASYEYGKIVRNGYDIAIIGKPNVGKSSLLNAILKDDRAIVTNIPGTTRDIIKEQINLKGYLVNFIDTAGIRDTNDIIEDIGVKKSFDVLSRADAILFLSDISDGIDTDLLEHILNYNNNILKIGNKCDIYQNQCDDFDLLISAKENINIDKLLDIIYEFINNKNIYSDTDIVITNIRHQKLLSEAKHYIQNAIESIKLGVSGELISVDIRNAIDKLSEIIGVITTDDILNNIFSRFCIGK